jgi:colanic acid/amylovoran biosynthesis glycosyltransferase
MKILMYSENFGGPTTTFIQNDLLGLSQNHTVKYLCCGIDPTGTFRYKDVAVVPYLKNRVTKKIRWILEKRGWYLTNKDRSFARGANTVIDAFNPEIIQCNFGIEALRLTDNLNKKNKRIPLVINFLGYDASEQLQRASYVKKLITLSKQAHRYATCNTGFLRKNLESRNIHFPCNRIIHTGVRLDFFDRKNEYPVSEKFIFLQIASFSYRKGQEVAIRAFRRFLDTTANPEKYQLVFAGGDDDPTCAAMRKLPAALQIADQVIFKDWVTPAESRELMIHAGCFIQHSRTIDGRTEGIPTAVSEAMAMELPVISTVHAGIPELVEDGVNGYLVAENDVEAFAQRMHDIQQFGYLKCNRAKVEKGFNIANRTAAFEKYYEEILQGSV